MVVTLFAFVFAFVVLAVIASKSIVVTKDDELLVILRLGQLENVRGPGRNFIMPFVDRAIKVNLGSIPGWDKLSQSELQLKAAQIALGEGGSEKS